MFTRKKKIREKQTTQQLERGRDGESSGFLGLLRWLAACQVLSTYLCISSAAQNRKSALVTQPKEGLWSSGSKKSGGRHSGLESQLHTTTYQAPPAFSLPSLTCGFSPDSHLMASGITSICMPEEVMKRNVFSIHKYQGFKTSA